MGCRAAASLALGLVVAFAGVGEVAAADSSNARTLAAAIERRAEATSFASLDAFGEAAARMKGREALRRLHHVAVIYLNQSEFDRFEHFNGLLSAKSVADGDARYRDVARIDELKSRYDRGEASAGADIARIAGVEPDWFARVHAMSMEAYLLSQQRQQGAALKLLFEAEAAIPQGDPESALAESDVWGNIGVALIGLSDLEGSAAAFQKADFVFADPAYPSPDFDDVYNMAYAAVRLGEADLARDLVHAHHRLVLRTDLPHLGVWDKYLCALDAEAFGAPQAVIDCFSGLDAHVSGGEFLAPQILSMRGIALARIGRAEESSADLARLRALEAGSQYAPSAFAREPELAAELLAAQGRPGAAFSLFRDYARGRLVAQARSSSAGASQVATELERQLDNATRQADLEQKVVRSQRWIGVLAGLLVFGVAVAFVWQRRVAKRLGVARLRAEAASRAKSEFLANMSHEIRTPLNGVVAVADMLATGQLPIRERKMAEIIRSSGQSLERLLSDVLDLARVEAGQITIESAPFQAADLVRSVAALCRLRADEKGLSLNVLIDPALEDWFDGDAVRVRQILLNLTSNAVKFTERGSVTIHGHSPAVGRLRFSVIDTGVGFEEAVKDRLFARFQQADGSITRRFGGSGLGLAISRQLAMLMGGEIDCESVPGVGSRFWFEAPFESVASPEADLEPEAAPAKEGPPLRVLVADDHATNQTVVRLMLEHFGIEAVVVDDGAKAVEALMTERFDAVLMDMQMPVMDGLEATRQIRRAEAVEGRPRTPILMISANALAEHREAGRMAGADGHVSKPFTLAGLLAALNNVLDSAQEPSVSAAAG